MSLLRNAFLPIALGLILAPAAWAGDDDKKASDKKGDEMTIRGVVSEVTILGETDIDYKTRKAITAEATYVTVIGHPWNKDAAENAREHASSDKDKDRDVKRTSNDSSQSAGHHRHRMNVYVIAVSPKTNVCECMETGKPGSGSVKEEKCDLDRLEIGDRVEVSFSPKMTDKESGQKAEPQKHGRHRTYFGAAKDIKILAEPMEGEHSASNAKK